MRLFSARLDIESYTALGNGIYQVEAYIIDNTGMYFASDVALGDIVYVSGLEHGYDILRYQVSDIKSAVGAKLIANLTWDMPYADFEPIEPYNDAIIGARHLSSTTANIVDVAINLANGKLIADARNYQQILTNVNIMTNSSLTPDKAYIHTQEEPSDVWTINHNMKKHPSVSVVDDQGMLVMCDIQYIDIDNVIITFAMPFSGNAYFN